VFDLPWIVAQERGFFADEGLDVQIAARRPVEHSAPRWTQKEQMFDLGEAQCYNACEWGVLRRVEQAGPRGWVIARRASLLTHCIVVRPGFEIGWPEDLAGRPVGVPWESGGHYSVLKMLEGYLRHDEIVCRHVPQGERLNALLTGEIDAAVFLEPHASVAEKAGYRTIAEAAFRGGEIVSDDVDSATVAAMMRGLRRSVAAINADLPTYRQRIVDLAVPGKLTVDEVRWQRVAYVDPQPYTREDFERARAWMSSWDLIDEDTTFEQIVNPTLALAVAG
jgi:NitT/TauT family transport system substrate-binding protein